jgi:hypothetical protein
MLRVKFRDWPMTADETAVRMRAITMGFMLVPSETSKLTPTRPAAHCSVRGGIDRRKREPHQQEIA